MKLCTRCHTVHDSASWADLPSIGRQDFGFSVLDLRNCTCGTTLALELPLTFVLTYEHAQYYPCREEFADLDGANARAADLGGDCTMVRYVGEPQWCGCAAFGPFVSECAECGA